MSEGAPPPRSRRGSSGATLAALPKGLLAGKYEVLGVLGEGGTGVVYDALRASDGASVALKVIHAHLAHDKQIRGRFQREAAILRRLEGPHICPILELGELPSAESGESLLYMALPKLDGPTLEHVLETERPIDVDRALDVMLEICAALRVAHGEGVIHRDLKPANVILERGKKAVVVDFGMSKIVTGAGTGTTNLTAHNMVFGTPEYMSPEQARGDELDARCDVYAAGIMLYEMLTGAPPFTGATPLNVLTEHLTSAVPPPSERAKDGRVTPALESVVMHALARSRDERYPSASALAAAIMHARAAPNDVHSLRPGAFATSPEGTDAFALTMPAIDVVAQPAVASRRAIVNGETPSDPPRALGTPGNTVPPVTKPSSQLPSKTPSTAPRSGPGGSQPPSKGSVRPKRPSPDKPAAAKQPLFHVDSTHTWIILWVLAGLASIALGVYFALR